MLKKITKLTIFISFLFLVVIIYEYKYKDDSKAWKNFQEPKMASYASLEKDQIILQELELQKNFKNYKILDPNFFVKQNIFESIQ